MTCIVLCFTFNNASMSRQAMASVAADVIRDARLPAAVYVDSVQEEGLREALVTELWDRQMPVLRCQLQLPAVYPATVLLAGSTDELLQSYRQLASLSGVRSQLLAWLLLLLVDTDSSNNSSNSSSNNSSNNSSWRWRLQDTLRESERVMVAVCHSEATQCAVYGARSPGSGRPSLVRWRPGDPLVDWRLWRLGGRELRVLAPLKKVPLPECNSDVIGSRMLPDNSTEICGYLGHTLLLLAEKLNFRPKFVRKTGCGVLQEDGSLNGRPSWLLAGRGDVGVGSCTKDLTRTSHVYMGEWFWSDTTSIGTSQPGAAADDFLVLGVFSRQLWAVTGAAILACGLLLRCCQWLTRRLAPPGGGAGKLASTVAYVQQSVRMFLAQGDDVSSDRASTRLLMGFIYMCSISLMSVYSGNLTAFLSLQRHAPPIDSLEQLAEARHVEPHVTFGQSHYYLLANASEGARGRIWRRMQQCVGCVHEHYRTTSSRQFVTRLVAGEVALFQSSRSLLARADQHLAARGLPAHSLCPVRVARQPLRRDYYALQLPPHSPLAHAVDGAVAELRYMGIIGQLFAREAANQCQTSVAEGSGTRVDPLSLRLVQGAFYLWLAGALASSLLLLLELLVGKFDPRRRHRRKQSPPGPVSAGDGARTGAGPNPGPLRRMSTDNVVVWTGSGKTTKVLIKRFD